MWLTSTVIWSLEDTFLIWNLITWVIPIMKLQAKLKENKRIESISYIPNNTDFKSSINHNLKKKKKNIKQKVPRGAISLRSSKTKQTNGSNPTESLLKIIPSVYCISVCPSFRQFVCPFVWSSVCPSIEIIDTIWLRI